MFAKQNQRHVLVVTIIKLEVMNLKWLQDIMLSNFLSICLLHKHITIMLRLIPTKQFIRVAGLDSDMV